MSYRSLRALSLDVNNISQPSYNMQILISNATPKDRNPSIAITVPNTAHVRNIAIRKDKTNIANIITK